MVVALFLDDQHPLLAPEVEMRFAWFSEFRDRHGLDNYDISWVTTAREAISILKGGKIKYVSLDHDLGEVGHAEYGEDKVPQLLSHEENMLILEEGGKSGYDVSRWIYHAVQAGRIPGLKWEIHSQNIIGRRNMEQYLSKIDD